MRRRLILMVVAAALVAAVVPAAAESKPRHVFALTFGDIVFGPETDDCPAGTVDFAVLSTTGAPLGTGSGCIQAIRPVGTSGQQVSVILTFELADGSIVVRARLREIFLSESSLAEVAHGRIVAGTGEFAGAEGKLRGEGTLVFNPDGSVDSTVVDVLSLKG
jgi:hypothetical protein